MIINYRERAELADKLGIRCSYDALFQMTERLFTSQELSFFQISYNQGRYHADVQIAEEGDGGQVYWCDDDDPFTALGSAIAKALGMDGEPDETAC